MKRCLLLALLSLFTARSDALENIIVNGGFAGGTLTPWTSTGNVTTSVIVPAARIEGDASLEQVVPTTVGARYYLGYSASNASNNGQIAEIAVKVAPTAGGNSNLSFTFRVPESARDGRFFTATSASSRLTLSTLEPTIVLMDNVVLFEIVVPSRFAGIYNGVAALELTSSTGARTRSKTTASAGIDEDGQIIILEGTSRAHAGVVFEDGTSIIRYFGQASPLETLADGVLLKGRTLTFSYGGVLADIRNEAGLDPGVVISVDFKLKRKAK